MAPLALALLASCSDETTDPVDGPCTKHSDCAYLAHHTDAWCRDGECVASCEEPIVNCRRPQVCVAHQCVDPGPCDDGYDCAPGEACEGSSCVVVPDVPSCAATPSHPVLTEVDLVAEVLAFRDADGDGARELVMVSGTEVIQLTSGQPTSPILLHGSESWIGDLAVADLDGDGLEDVVLAGEGLRTITAAGVGALSDDKRYYDVELCDLPPHDGVIEGVALGSARRPTSLSNDGNGNLFGEVPAHENTEDRFIAGASLDGHRRAIIGRSEGITPWMFPAQENEPTHDQSHRDSGVIGRALAGGDIVAGGSDELLRLSPGYEWTIATRWSLEGEKLVPGPRGRIAASLELVQVGDVDGDGEVDAVLAGRDGVVLWRAPGLPASPTTGCVSTLTLDNTKAVAIGDHDGDGRADIAFATESAVRVLAVVP